MQKMHEEDVAKVREEKYLYRLGTKGYVNTEAEVVSHYTLFSVFLFIILYKWSFLTLDNNHVTTTIFWHDN